MAEKALVIVESPTKAKTIAKFLDKNFIIKASNGHIRDLPNSAAEIPAKHKKAPWARTGINVDADFEALYIVPPKKRDQVKALEEALKKADILYLATDEDREGESISWHLVQELKPKIPYKRLVFHEITREAIKHSLETPREIDQSLVHAQETRRIIDRLFGYEVSPLLWKKMTRGLSAGRVQSVSVKLLVDRERERLKFQRAIYWGLSGIFGKLPGKSETFPAELTHIGSDRIAIGKDFDPTTGKLKASSDCILLQEERARSLREAVLSGEAHVHSVEEKPFTQKPPAPFVTSSLQQEGNRKLRLSAKRTMSIAQQLYENGFITYMRTDSTTLSEQALNAARSFISSQYGAEYLPPAPRLYSTKVKNAQEAHEAIRPAGESFTPPEVVRNALGEEAYRLYDLIWKRTVASQMKDAQGTYTTLTIIAGNAQSGEARFRASGKTISFAGFLRAYVEGTDDPDAELADQETVLPPLKEGEAVAVVEVKAEEHATQPAARYTEGSLIKELERLGIGRPSTWATIVELVLSRSYAFKKGTALVPTYTALAVVSLLEGHFSNLVDYQYTARLEDSLDAISRGEAESQGYLKSFYFGNGTPGLKALVKQGEAQIDPRVVCGVSLGTTPDGTPLEVRIGKYGPFISDGTRRASVPDELAPDELTVTKALELLELSAKGADALCHDPKTGKPIYFKSGLYGPYVQLGESGDEEKPKTVSLLRGMTIEDVTPENALRLLELPKRVGENPETGKPVDVLNGRFGPYIKSGDDTRSISGDWQTVLNLDLAGALEILKTPKTGGRGRGKPAPLHTVGDHPTSGKPLQIMNGKYGMYVTDGEINATLPKGREPQTITLEEAVSLVDTRAAKIASGEVVVKKKRTPKAKAPAKEKIKEKSVASKPKRKKAADMST